MGVTLVLLLIYTSAQLVELFNLVTLGSLRVDTVLILLGLRSLGGLVFILPLAFYLATLLTFSRFYRDNEMVVLAACGIGPGRILRTVFVVAVMLAVGVGTLSLYITPLADKQSRTMIKLEESSSKSNSFSAGRFRESAGGNGVVYVETVNADDNRMMNVFIQQYLDNRESIIVAKSGFQQKKDEASQRYLVLENGARYEGTPGRGGYTVIEFEQHGIRIEEKGIISSGNRPQEKTTLELINSDLVSHIAEFQWRLSAVFLCLVLSILAIPLSRTSARQGRYAKVGVALIIYILYTNLLNISRVWIEQGEIVHQLGMWWVHGLFFIIATLMYVHPNTYKKLIGRKIT